MDKYTYDVAGVDEIFLFKKLSNVFKDFYWKMLGMWERITKAAWDETKGSYKDFVELDVNVNPDKIEEYKNFEKEENE